MLKWLLGKKTAGEPVKHDAGLSEAAQPEGMAWLAGTSLPIPDWQQQAWPQEAEDEALHRHANGLAAAWLDAAAAALGSGAENSAGYSRLESEHFMLLSAMPPREASLLLNYLERSRKRVLGTLPGIAAGSGHGKSVVMVFSDEESYYQYITNYGSESSEPEAYSGGMFIDAGYGHFVFAQGPFERIEPTVVHELTHCLVRHLPIPAWLNEGLAVNTEHRFAPQRPRYRANELQHLFSRFWNPSTIQEFWSGKSFLRPDDGQPLSYELAKHLVQLLDKDYELLTRFSKAASYTDGGEAAAVEVLGMSLEDLMAVILGPGSWKPDPAAWRAGTEKGQFRLRA